MVEWYFRLCLQWFFNLIKNKSPIRAGSNHFSEPYLLHYPEPGLRKLNRTKTDTDLARSGRIRYDHTKISSGIRQKLHPVLYNRTPSAKPAIKKELPWILFSPPPKSAFSDRSSKKNSPYPNTARLPSTRSSWHATRIQPRPGYRLFRG